VRKTVKETFKVNKAVTTYAEVISCELEYSIVLSTSWAKWTA